MSKKFHSENIAADCARIPQPEFENKDIERLDAWNRTTLQARHAGGPNNHAAATLRLALTQA
jgi:hypothetical protein